MLAIILFEITTTNKQNIKLLVSFVDLWLDLLEFVYIIMLFNSSFVHVVNFMLLIIYYILWYCIGSKVFVGGSILRSDTTEPVIQSVLYDWTSEPADR